MPITLALTYKANQIKFPFSLGLWIHFYLGSIESYVTTHDIK